MGEGKGVEKEMYKMGGVGQRREDGVTGKVKWKKIKETIKGVGKEKR